IASGHGAFMLEQREDKPNIFTASVGNLAPGKEVMIGLTYITDLDFEDGKLKFLIPALVKQFNPTQFISMTSSIFLSICLFNLFLLIKESFFYSYLSIYFIPTSIDLFYILLYAVYDS